MLFQKKSTGDYFFMMKTRPSFLRSLINANENITQTTKKKKKNYETKTNDRDCKNICFNNSLQSNFFYIKKKKNTKVT